MTSFTVDKLNRYFKGKIMTQLTNIISDKLTRDNISVLNINSYLSDISEFCQERIAQYFQRYGLIAQEFDVISISVKEDDPSFQKLKEAKDLAARVKIAGRDIYQMDRSFNVLDNAATNEGSAGGLMNAGLGLGLGMNVGTQMGAGVGASMNINHAQQTVIPPPLPQTHQYYIAINGQRQGPIDMNTITSMINNGSLQPNTLIWKPGMPNWDKIQNLPEFSSYFMNCPPPLPNI